LSTKEIYNEDGIQKLAVFYFFHSFQRHAALYHWGYKKIPTAKLGVKKEQ
jgi:hypothetical protein